MKHNRLGREGPLVSELGLGTMAFADASVDQVRRLVDMALDAGIDLIDTADVYAQGRVEELLGEALAGGRRSRVTLATKFGLPMGDAPEQRGGSARWIHEAVEHSLRRLRTDWIDIYQLHRPDPATPMEETLGALDTLQRSGKIRFAGSSAMPAEQIVEAQWLGEREGLATLTTEQPAYSLFVRSPEQAVFPTCQTKGVGAITWSPLNGGWLTGKYQRDKPAPPGSRGAQHNPFVNPQDPVKLDKIEALVRLCESADLELAQVAVAWCLEHPAVGATLLGPRSADQLAPFMHGLPLLDTSLLDAIDEILPPGQDLDARNSGWRPPGMAVAARRRSHVMPGQEGSENARQSSSSL